MASVAIRTTRWEWSASIIVGEPTNLDAAKQAKLPGKAGEVMTKLLGSL